MYFKHRFYKEALDELEDALLPTDADGKNFGHPSRKEELGDGPDLILPPRKSLQRRGGRATGSTSEKCMGSTATHPTPPVVSSSPLGPFTAPDAEDGVPELTLPPRARRPNNRRLAQVPLQGSVSVRSQVIPRFGLCYVFKKATTFLPCT